MLQHWEINLDALDASVCQSGDQFLRLLTDFISFARGVHIQHVPERGRLDGDDKPSHLHQQEGVSLFDPADEVGDVCVANHAAESVAVEEEWPGFLVDPTACAQKWW